MTRSFAFVRPVHQHPIGVDVSLANNGREGC